MCKDTNREGIPGYELLDIFDNKNKKTGVKPVFSV